MRDRAWGGWGPSQPGPERQVSPSRKPPGRGRRPSVEDLEGRQLLTAALATIPDVTVPAALGSQVPLDGSAGGAPSQTYTVTSSNPNIKATVAQGQFVTFNVTHTAATGSTTDISFAGSITFQFFNDLTPNTAQTIENIIKNGFYTNKIFHRVSSGFPDATHYIVQGGSATGTGAGNSGQPGTPFADEFNQQLAFTGAYQLAMANSGPNTNDTQFFITTGQPRFLDFHHTIFAQLVSGVDIVNKMTQVAVNGTSPLSPITITNATVSTTNPDGVIHVDATTAAAGATATITVTATDPATNTTAPQTFHVTARANTQTERPFVNSIPNRSVGLNQVDTFPMPVVSPTPNDPLTYTVDGGYNAATNAFTPIQNATATVNPTTGVVTITPTPGFTGTIPVLYGVRDQTQRAVSPTTGQLLPVTDPMNFQWQMLTLTVNPVGAASFTKTATLDTPLSIQLQGVAANGAAVTYAVTRQPAHGTISQFNAATGGLVYTPAAGFTGADSFQYTASAAGQTTAPATVSINVTPFPPGDSRAVRVVGRVLVVTPVPRTDGGTNTILITQVNSGATAALQVEINGLVDLKQPLVSTIDRIVVYGSKNSDTITIDPSVTVTDVTLDGGHGGKNTLTAGATATRMHGWFGHNVLVGGAGTNQMIGQAGHVKFKPSSATNVIYAGVVQHRTEENLPRPPVGTHYKFVNGHLVPEHLNQSTGHHHPKTPKAPKTPKTPPPKHKKA